MAVAINLQEYLVQMVQIPLIQATFYTLVLIMIILMLSLIWDVVSWKRKKYQLTNQRVIIKKGLIRRKKSYIHYSKIQDIDVYQGIVDRIFSAGDIELYGGHEHTNISGRCSNPREVEDISTGLWWARRWILNPSEVKHPKNP